MEDKVLEIAFQYFKDKGWIPFDFQVQTWKDYLEGKSGLLNAPTGSGKTFALWFPVILVSHLATSPLCVTFLSHLEYHQHVALSTPFLKIFQNVLHLCHVGI
jgi:hypothetical protein